MSKKENDKKKENMQEIERRISITKNNLMIGKKPMKETVIDTEMTIIIRIDIINPNKLTNIIQMIERRISKEKKSGMSNIREIKITLQVSNKSATQISESIKLMMSRGRDRPATKNRIKEKRKRILTDILKLIIKNMKSLKDRNQDLKADSDLTPHQKMKTNKKQ